MEEEKKIKKVQILGKSYYLRKDVQNIIFNFCKNRETIANHNNEFFGKRPDCFDYPTDIGTAAKKGATSFHCSEEIWSDPLKIDVNMTPEDYNNIRTGWDLLIDIDSKYFDYSRVAAKLLIKALEHHGVQNIGVKFSGSKGFHILVPFKAFPEEINGELTKDHFPDWARLVAGYLNELIHTDLTNEILKLSNIEEITKKGKAVFEIICKNCGGKATTKKIGEYQCPNYKCRAKVNSMKSNRKTMVCPSCNDKMERVYFEELTFCENCNLNSKKNPENFEKRATVKELIDSVDIILVAPRHLFRAPYSLHEKTSLVSIVIDKKEIDSFKPQDADPLRIKEFLDFSPNCKDGEATDLLIQALDWSEKEDVKTTKKYSGDKIDLKGLTISEDMFPPIIKKINKGIKDDGRKRALYILLSFYNSLEFPQDYISEKVHEWNNKNYHPLKEGYLKSQLSWFEKRKPLPPNYDKPVYKEFGINGPPEPGIKNPINYTIKMALKAKGRKAKKG